VVGEFHVDLLVNHRVIVEVKAVIGAMPNVFSAQLLAYLKAADMSVGLLVNFGNPSCQVKRLSAPRLEPTGDGERSICEIAPKSVSSHMALERV